MTQAPAEKKHIDGAKTSTSTYTFLYTITIYFFCREVWPENDSFGHAGLAPEEEFLSMREIFMTDIGQPTGK